MACGVSVRYFSRMSTPVTVTQRQDYQFLVEFNDTIPPLLVDEPAPIGSGLGPSPSQLLRTSVAHCLLASLLFALRKFKQDGGVLRASATDRVERNQEKRLRVQEITVAITLGRPAGEIDHLDRILSQFEAFCTVSQSVGRGIPLVVTVHDSHGVQVK